MRLPGNTIALLNMHIPKPSSWLWLALAVALADRITKSLVEAYLHSPITLLPGFNLRLGYNPGAAWGLLAEAGGWQRWVLAGIAATIAAILLVWLHRTQAKLLRCGLALVLGGAIGNLYDRLVHGGVTDFIDLYWHTWHWPTFNLADTAITIGGALIVWDALRRPA